jgi:alpha-galactosidase
VSTWELRTAGRVRHLGTASPAFRHGESGVAGPRYRVRGSGELVDAGLEVPFRLAPDCDVVVLDRVTHG